MVKESNCPRKTYQEGVIVGACTNQALRESNRQASFELVQELSHEAELADNLTTSRHNISKCLRMNR